MPFSLPLFIYFKKKKKNLGTGRYFFENMNHVEWLSIYSSSMKKKKFVGHNESEIISDYIWFELTILSSKRSTVPIWHPEKAQIKWFLIPASLSLLCIFPIFFLLLLSCVKSRFLNAVFLRSCELLSQTVCLWKIKQCASATRRAARSGDCSPKTSISPSHCLELLTHNKQNI